MSDDYKEMKNNKEDLDFLEDLLHPIELRRDLLIEHLHIIQDYYGFLSEKNLTLLSKLLKISKVEVYEVASFYAHFDIVKNNEVPPPNMTIRVCNSLSCEISGSSELEAQLLENYNSKEVRILKAPCMGRCFAAPTVEIGHYHVDNADINKIRDAIKNNRIKPEIPDYENFENYINKGGYKKFSEIISNINGDNWYDDLIKSDLRGLGGAGFRTAKKWQLVSNEQGPRYLAVNGDEGEPGTFKDRHYLETEPHMFLEGMLIASLAISAEKCFIYIRDEYPAILKILKEEIRKLEDNNIISKHYIDVRRGAGAYICGEESAMIESIEGKRGLPRHRPPFVGQVGVFGRPTLVHNVETLYWVSKIMRDGSHVFNNTIKNDRIGLRSYSVSGRVKKPGLYLLPSGSTILDIIDSAGGMSEGHTFKAYQPGGASSGLLPASLNNVPLDFDTLNEHNTFIGSAAVVILSNQDKIRQVALNMIEFFKAESCGQCTPCRVGCEKAVTIMNEQEWDIELLEDLCEVMESSSICGLGQAATNPIRSSIKYFPDEIKNHA
ncbi:NADH-ubiquinone oxidoreductase-F iron-sulfur binding region domain-containing protein [Candidatus Levibacter sp. Uisw_134_01]|uniref:NADH-ubiquinone oxidoreductase-F iron-sulfur binding region domain-containing protein n=1 Tax=Candidatus Levibacter sp. Uisw_134_01 TaxID=3230999 RepID=UPI003FD889A5